MPGLNAQKTTAGGSILIAGLPLALLQEDSAAEPDNAICSELLQSDVIYVWNSLVQRFTHTFRMLHLPPVRPMELPFETLFLRIQDDLEQKKRIVIIADGDPLYFGIAATVKNAFPNAPLRILPQISSMQVACARCHLPWSTLQHISFHGRDSFSDLFAALGTGANICVLCDDAHSPNLIAKYLLERDLCNLTFHTFSKLCSPHERYTRTPLENFATKPLSEECVASPCLLLIEKTHPSPHPCLGLPETRQKTYASNIAVRATALALLQIHATDTVWDVGAGSGSVALEACSLAHRGRVFAIEENSDRVQQIRANRARFGACTLEIVQAHAPNCFGQMPRPNAVFLGGGLSNDPFPLLEALYQALLPGGRLVASCVLFTTLHNVQAFFKKKAQATEILELTVARSKPLGCDMHLKAENPVFLISYKKENIDASEKENR